MARQASFVTPELQSFIYHFKNEEQLRSAIEGLLSKCEECQGVRNLHGKDENGKDLIFQAPAGLGRLKLNACVVKLVKVSGSASDPKSDKKLLCLGYRTTLRLRGPAVRQQVTPP